MEVDMKVGIDIGGSHIGVGFVNNKTQVEELTYQNNVP